MRRERRRQARLRRSRQRDDDKLGAPDRRAEVGGRQRNGDVAPAAQIGQRYALAAQHRPEGLRIAPPEPHAVSRFREVGRGGIAAVAAAQDGDLHDCLRKLLLRDL